MRTIIAAAALLAITTIAQSQSIESKRAPATHPPATQPASTQPAATQPAIVGGKAFLAMIPQSAFDPARTKAQRLACVDGLRGRQAVFPVKIEVSQESGGFWNLRGDVVGVDRRITIGCNIRGDQWGLASRIRPGDVVWMGGTISVVQGSFSADTIKPDGRPRKHTVGTSFANAVIALPDDQTYSKPPATFHFNTAKPSVIE